METDELRRRVGEILAAEELEPADWAAVECLTSELQRQLRSDPTAQPPEVVNHYLDDADIRTRDYAYAVQQRRHVRRFVEFAEYDDSKPIPLTCAQMLCLQALHCG